MRSYYIDEFAPDELERLAGRLDDMELGAGMEALYWLPVPEELLTPLQREHERECGPYVLALEILDGALRLELLVRARNRLRCDCVAYAEHGLVQHMIAYLHGLLDELKIAG
ncbi:MAG: hypothetical protein LBC79_09420 [Deltaproteobacteria bacterium]|jgi:hypothetical protein|nr:hypothetical protein [Deltaproteobacteria bacterium]